MSKQPSIEGKSADGGALTVLSISPNDDDHSLLETIFGHCRWALLKANRLRAAWSVLEEHEVSVILCERDLEPGTWVDLLAQIQSMRNPPSLIVTSRLADEKLWSEALNLGAWDVLAKPYDRHEVLRSIRSAWEHWHHQYEVSALPMKAMSATG